jgi:hypothetical protein
MTGLGLIAVGLAVAPVDLAAEVKTVFAAKCAACHGPDLAKPKGRFGYVLDLARVAGNREMVVPSAPDESELWELVRRGEMPPADSPAGPLSAAQKQAIRAWIAAGAPAGVFGDAPTVSLSDATLPTATTLPETLRRLGRFHVVLVHFPIALLIAAAAGEGWSILRHRSTPAAAVHFCVVLGAAGAVASAALGWLDAWSATGAGVLPHRCLGTATAGWAFITAGLSIRDERRGARSGWFRAALLVAAVLVGATGHSGGVLVHGDLVAW